MELPSIETVQSEDQYLYHTTSKSNKRSINRHGFNPTKEKSDSIFDKAYVSKADEFIRRITDDEIGFQRDDECVFFFTLWDHIEVMYSESHQENSLVFVVDATKIEQPLYVADAMAFTEVMDAFAKNDGVVHSGMADLTQEPSTEQMVEHAERYLDSLEKIDSIDELKDRAWEAAEDRSVLEVIVPGHVSKGAIVGDLTKS